MVATDLCDRRTFPVDISYLEDVVEQTGYVLESDSEFAKYDDSYDDDYGQAMDALPTGSETPLDESYCANTQSVIARMREDRINYELIELLLVHVDEHNASTSDAGAILVFLPGLAEISRLMTRLMSNPVFYEGDRFRIIPLHSSVSQADQSSVFKATPRNCRKVVLATNIAETVRQHFPSSLGAARDAAGKTAPCRRLRCIIFLVSSG